MTSSALVPLLVAKVATHVLGSASGILNIAAAVPVRATTMVQHAAGSTCMAEILPVAVGQVLYAMFLLTSDDNNHKASQTTPNKARPHNHRHTRTHTHVVTVRRTVVISVVTSVYRSDR